MLQQGEGYPFEMRFTKAMVVVLFLKAHLEVLHILQVILKSAHFKFEAISVSTVMSPVHISNRWLRVRLLIGARSQQPGSGSCLRAGLLMEIFIWRAL